MKDMGVIFLIHTHSLGISFHVTLFIPRTENSLECQCSVAMNTLRIYRLYV